MFSKSLTEQKVLSLDLKHRQSLTRTACGKEFQTDGADNRKALYFPAGGVVACGGLGAGLVNNEYTRGTVSKACTPVVMARAAHDHIPASFLIGRVRSSGSGPAKVG